MILIPTQFGWAAVRRGVTDAEILIGQWDPQTGPAALWGAVARGTGVFFDLVNEEGGIAGRKIKYFMRDDAYQPSKTKAIAKEFVESLGDFRSRIAAWERRPVWPRGTISWKIKFPG